MSSLPVSPWDLLSWACNKGKAVVKAAIFHLRGSAVFDDLEGFERARPAKKYFTSPRYKTYALGGRAGVLSSLGWSNEVAIFGLWSCQTHGIVSLSINWSQHGLLSS